MAFLVRFDDLCPTMNWDIWERVEDILIRNSVTPILSIVPDNQDPRLDVAPTQPAFWSRVREWQGRGWTIGLHGYQHLYLSRSAGIVGTRPLSEFAEPAAGIDDLWSALVGRGEATGASVLVCADGARRYIEYSAKAHVLPGRHLAVLRDVTERRALERELSRAHQLESVGRLAGGVAQDFNNMLTAIRGYARLRSKRSVAAPA